jgi:hypothetical protein
MTQENLWVDFPTEAAPGESPVSVLAEQASLVKELSKGLLIGKIETRQLLEFVLAATGSNLKFVTTLDIIAPSLENYRLRILEYRHDLVPFPGHLASDLAKFKHDVAALPEFKAMVKSILSSEEIKNAIRSILSFMKARSSTFSKTGT